MRIMIDSNVIVSAIYNQKSKPAAVVNHVLENHTLVLCDRVINECCDVVGRKFPQHLSILDKFFKSVGYELQNAPSDGPQYINPKDSPILNAAIHANVDMTISGDGHFLALYIEQLEVISPSVYFEKFFT